MYCSQDASRQLSSLRQFYSFGRVGQSLSCGATLDLHLNLTMVNSVDHMNRLFYLITQDQFEVRELKDYDGR